MSKNQKVIFTIILAVFLGSRFLGLGQIYHQDEYRWATIVNPVFNDGNSPHPPITQLSLEITGQIFGYDHLRIAPLIFSMLCLLLIFLVSFRISKKIPVAILAVFLFTISTYSYIANLQIDIDGAVLPFFGLLTFYSYWMVFKEKKPQWGVVLAIAVVGGFLTKLSFVLFILALVADHLLDIWRSKLSRGKLKSLLPLAGLLLMGVVIFVLFLSKMSFIIDYAEHFKSLDFTSRAYFDLAFKIFKSLVWLSPILTLPVIAGLLNREYVLKYRFWYLYLLANLLFYVVLFDFSRLTIERYFMFMIVPAVFISAQWLYDAWVGIKLNKKVLITSILVFVALAIFAVYANPQVLPLNPKIAYVNKIKHLDFNFLIPMTGGSGPIGFYVSALFVLVVWVVGVSGALAVIYRYKYKNALLLLFLVFGIGYNLVLTNENVFGSMYGSVDGIAKMGLGYIDKNPNIKEVITYYDTGAYYLREFHKYSSRFYTAPTRDYTKKLTEYRGHYMIVDFPAIDKSSDYWKLINRCPIDKKFNDKKVDIYIFDCQKI